MKFLEFKLVQFSKSNLFDVTSCPCTSWNNIPINKRQQISFHVVHGSVWRILEGESFHEDSIVSEFCEEEFLITNENRAPSIPVIMTIWFPLVHKDFSQIFSYNLTFNHSGSSSS